MIVPAMSATEIKNCNPTSVLRSAIPDFDPKNFPLRTFTIRKEERTNAGYNPARVDPKKNIAANCRRSSRMVGGAEHWLISKAKVDQHAVYPFVVFVKPVIALLKAHILHDQEAGRYPDGKSENVDN